MKIACQSCQAKYTIADEKVVGKVVKIRCKKCGSTIVVNGQDDSSREERTEIRSSPLGSAGSDAPADEWVVNYADNDQRNMTTGQIIAEFSTGALSDETYCWRDGMDDWLPLREMGELAAACGLTVVSSVQQQQPLAAREPEPYDPAPAAAPMESYPGSPAAGPGGNALSSIFGSQPAPAPTPGYAAPAAQPDSGAAAARRAGGRGGGADLFGAAATAGSESDVMTSAPQHPTATADGKLTGQRNENSVLFSLATLTAGSAKKGPDAGAVNEDGSGLIDIRALSTSMGTAGGPHKASHADDIMNLGGGGAFSAPLAAPVLTAALADSGDPNAPAAAANNTKLYAMFGGLAALLIVGMVGMFFALRPPATPLALNAPAGSGVAAPGGSAPAASAPSVAASAPAPSADPAASVAAADPGVKATAPAVGTQKRSTGAGAGAGAAAAIPPAAAPAARRTVRSARAGRPRRGHRGERQEPASAPGARSGDRWLRALRPRRRGCISRRDRRQRRELQEARRPDGRGARADDLRAERHRRLRHRRPAALRRDRRGRLRGGQVPQRARPAVRRRQHVGRQALHHQLSRQQPRHEADRLRGGFACGSCSASSLASSSV